MADRCPTDVKYEFHGMEQRNYNPIEIARQYAPKFDKPVVDMVAAVRCKDCKYRYGDKDEPYCDRINPYSRVRVEDDDFCSWGEKNDIK